MISYISQSQVIQLYNTKRVRKDFGTDIII